MGRHFKSILFFVVLIAVWLHLDWHARDRVNAIYYDLRNGNQPVYEQEKINDIFSSFEPVSAQELPARYLSATQYDRAPYDSMLAKATLFRVSRADMYRYVAGDFRLRDFLCRDDFFKACVLGRTDSLYIVLSPRLVHKTLELMDELYRRGYNETGFELVNGHRQPQYNERIGGASKSRHIIGEAADISIYDIDGDGDADRRDKDIVLGLLDSVIIRDKGGIGLYPGTYHVHYDVRGYKARWNSF